MRDLGRTIRGAIHLHISDDLLLSGSPGNARNSSEIKLAFEGETSPLTFLKKLKSRALYQRFGL